MWVKDGLREVNTLSSCCPLGICWEGQRRNWPGDVTKNFSERCDWCFGNLCPCKSAGGGPVAPGLLKPRGPAMDWRCSSDPNPRPTMKLFRSADQDSRPILQFQRPHTQHLVSGRRIARRRLTASTVECYRWRCVQGPRPQNPTEMQGHDTSSAASARPTPNTSTYTQLGFQNG
jgi:hypothetical protein